MFEPAIHTWHRIENSIRDLYQAFGYTEIRTPILEPTALFKRSVGDQTDIVEKEMYTFQDGDGESLSLRPEGTAAVVRALIEHNYIRDNPTAKLYYIAPMFRHERPQKGRYRQFHQYGLELIGPQEANADAEIICVHSVLYSEMGLKDVELRLSSVGCSNCRPGYRHHLSEKLLAIKNELPEHFHPKIQTNPQRVFDLKDDRVRKLVDHLPKMLDQLCEGCRDHLGRLQKSLAQFGVKFVLDPNIVRGLDYYNRTAFEFTSAHLGAQSAVGGGGRYDSLFESLGGKPTAAVGYAGGVERLAILLESAHFAEKPRPVVHFIALDEAGLARCETYCFELRQRRIYCEVEYAPRSVKAQMKRADKLQSRFAAIIGASELESDTVTLKDMSTQSQTSVAGAKFVEHILGLSDR